MNAFSQRTWVPFYLVSFGTLSMAVFRSMDGFMLLGSLVLVTVALGIIFLAIQAEVTKNLEKKELMEILSKKVLTAGETGDPGAK
ncbi:MAG TPA: hypothetical protein VKO45_04005 [Methanomicrobiales archaeon]|nr:hypothetical protein [Methanomicrobiales archaeon]